MFGRLLHLTQTGQLYLESAAMSYGRVYCFRPTFRAEKSKTRRHLTEFWTVEPEVAFIDLDEVNTRIENNPKHAQLAAEFRWGKDLGGSDGTIISMMHDKPVFVTHYPREAKAFYMKTDRQNEQVVENFDLLAPTGFGEIIGGSVREDDHDRLLARIKDQGLNPETYDWYLDLRKYGSVPHGGFGLGVERTVAWVIGERHIRQCIPFPRMMDKVYI
jgi:asparaginyl-tRNA synthetase